MTKEQHIPFEDFARSLAGIFDRLARQRTAVFVERAGRLYRLEPADPAAPAQPQLAPHDDIWADYSQERVLEGLRASAGALDGVNTAQLLNDLHAQREQHREERHD